MGEQGGKTQLIGRPHAAHEQTSRLEKQLNNNVEDGEGSGGGDGNGCWKSSKDETRSSPSS